VVVAIAGALVAVGLLVLMVVLVEARPAGAAFPGKNGKIAYLDSRGLYTINPNGTGRSKVTNASVFGDNPLDYSPTGKKITYADYEGYDGNDTEIYTINVGGGSKFQVTHTNTNELDPSYSTNGKRIAFAGDNRTYADYDTEIYTIDVGGKNRVRLTNNATHDYGPDYSPNGKRIAYYDWDGHDNEIFTIRVQGGGKSKVTEGAFPSYSPNGKKIAYTGGRGRNSEIYTINVGGEGKYQVTDTKSYASNPSWGSRPWRLLLRIAA
jgi:TolB protein